MTQLNSDQERAVGLVMERIPRLREPNRTTDEVRAALRIEGWCDPAIDEAMRREETAVRP